MFGGSIQGTFMSQRQRNDRMALIPAAGVCIVRYRAML